MELPIILTHYGNSKYLGRTLTCASVTNPGKIRILIGDERNRDLARDHGWQHVQVDTIGSELRSEFDASFRHIQGRNHRHMKNGRDWLKFVFERWFVIEAYCRTHGIDNFWHFDSDVMVLEDLRPFEQPLMDKACYTRQCNDTCLNGLVSSKILGEYCKFTTSLFRDEPFVAQQQASFEGEASRFAFTEMRAFDLYSKSKKCPCKGVALESAVPGWWFDDCVIHADDFEMTSLCAGGLELKKVHFESGRFYGSRRGTDTRFAILNLSCVPNQVFDWVLACIHQRERQPTFRSSITRSPVRLGYKVRCLYRLAKTNAARYIASWRGKAAA